MADYCAEADIVENLKGVTFSSTTSVTDDALENIITQESATIDAHIQTRYTLPIAEAAALEFLKKICIALVIYRVTNILQPKEIRPIPNQNAEQDISHYSAYKDAMRMLKNIMDGKMSLPAETPASIGGVVTACPMPETNFVYEETQW